MKTMASVTLTITDRPDGGLEVSFKGHDLKTVTTLKRNTAAQNAAISLVLWMAENGLESDAPDLTSDQALHDWLSKNATEVFHH